MYCFSNSLDVCHRDLFMKDIFTEDSFFSNAFNHLRRLLSDGFFGLFLDVHKWRLRFFTFQNEILLKRNNYIYFAGFKHVLTVYGILISILVTSNIDVKCCYSSKCTLMANHCFKKEKLPRLLFTVFHSWTLFETVVAGVCTLCSTFCWLTGNLECWW